MVIFLCDACHSPLQIGDNWAGKLGHCPHRGTNSRVPGRPKRSSKLTILARMVACPVAVVAFWSFFLGLPVFVGGAIAVAIGLFFCWAFNNVVAFACHPRYYRLWKAGGGDPWFDTLDPPFNNDPPSTRFQELCREKARLECEAVDRMFGLTPPCSPDPMRGIDDPGVI